MTLLDLYVKEQLNQYTQFELAQQDRRGILRHRAYLARKGATWWLGIAQSLQSTLHLFHNRMN